MEATRPCRRRAMNRVDISETLAEEELVKPLLLPKHKYFCKKCDMPFDTRSEFIIHSFKHRRKK